MPLWGGLIRFVDTRVSVNFSRSETVGRDLGEFVGAVIMAEARLGLLVRVRGNEFRAFSLADGSTMGLSGAVAFPRWAIDTRDQGHWRMLRGFDARA